MPEGDTIFRSARSLHRALSGKAITAFRSAYPLLTRFHDDTPLTGRTVERVESRGKWLLIHFSGAATLATHMLMRGSWHIYRPGERWQRPAGAARIVLENADYVAVAFDVPLAEMHTPASLIRSPRIPRPAGDLLSGDFDAQGAVERVMAQPEEAIGEALLRQRLLAGVGNVFKSEVCFATGLNPFRKVRTLTREQVEQAVATARSQLGANVMEDSPDRIVTYGGLRRTTRNSKPSESLWVYGREGRPCRRCGEPIRSRLQGLDARRTYWCPRCQPLPGGADCDG